MSGSLSDILTTGKNIVTAISTLGQNYLNVQGASIAKNITASTLVKPGSGRVVTVIVTVAGSTDGAIYDAISTAAASPNNLIWTIHKDATVSAATSVPVVLNLPFKDGLVITPGTGMTVIVSYS
jgi:hypothetical protein